MYVDSFYILCFFLINIPRISTHNKNRYGERILNINIYIEYLILKCLMLTHDMNVYRLCVCCWAGYEFR